MNEDFLIRHEELVLRHVPQEADRRALSYANVGGDFAAWRDRCKAKLAELIHLSSTDPGPVTELRRTDHNAVTVAALVMQAEDDLTIPAYLLTPPQDRRPGTAVMAIHGHSPGLGEGCLGLAANGYRGFAMRLAEAGFVVLLPIHRGFGPLRDLALHRPGYRLDYEKSMHFAYVTDSFLHGRTVVGDNVSDLLRWENWLTDAHGIERILAAGLSYGGDLALAYPPFSDRVERIFASGSSGSFGPHFRRCYNGPAHCIPGILNWMDRSDIAGLNAPRPLVMHYGERDTPSLDDPAGENYAAACNESADTFLAEAKQIYAAAGAADNIRMIVTPDVAHVMDVEALVEFLTRD